MFEGLGVQAPSAVDPFAAGATTSRMQAELVSGSTAVNNLIRIDNLERLRPSARQHNSFGLLNPLLTSPWFSRAAASFRWQLHVHSGREAYPTPQILNLSTIPRPPTPTAYHTHLPCSEIFYCGGRTAQERAYHGAWYC